MDLPDTAEEFGWYSKMDTGEKNIWEKMRFPADNVVCNEFDRMFREESNRIFEIYS